MSDLVCESDGGMDGRHQIYGSVSMLWHATVPTTRVPRSILLEALDLYHLGPTGLTFEGLDSHVRT